MKRRVVITGLGPISPNGIGRDEFWRNTIRGKSGIKKITYFDIKEFTTKIAGEVRNFDVLKLLSKKEARRLDKFSQFAVVATEMTLKDAKFDINSQNSERVGVVVGSGIGGLETLEREHKILLEKGPGRVSPFLIPMMISNMAAGNVSILFGAKGPNYCVISACATSTHAVGEGYKIIKEGDADYCICGGVEASITPLALAGFCSVRALSKRNEEPEKASRPFDAERDGFVMSEGAGILFLEELEGAINREANIYCEVIGYGMSADAYHITSPDPEGKGAVNSMNMSLKNAGIKPEDIDYINAHGTSTKFNDEFETLAIKKLFKDHAYKLMISSTKSVTGHLLGATGGLEAIATALTIKNSEIPPTMNLKNPDPECDLNYVPNKSIKKDVRFALSNSFGFGGHNATLAFKKYTS